MIPIKIECGCGQHYAFEADPAAGLLPGGVACPTCGADGTGAANEVLAQAVPVRPAPPVVRVVTRSAPAAVAVAAPAAAAPARHILLPGQMARPQAESEARAKMLWGDAPVEVLKFLMMQGVPREEAQELVAEFSRERAATIRSGGIGKIITGVLMVLVPIVGFFVFARIGFLPLKIFALMVAVGLWGVWRIFKGTLMIVAPRIATGDASEQ